VAGPTGAPGVPARATAVLRAEGRRGSRRRWAVIVAAAVLTLMVLVAVTAALGSGGDAATPAAADVTPSTTAPATPTTTAPATPTAHDLAAAELVGRPLTDVRGRLTALGLQVQPRPITTGDVPDGQVIAVDPNGQVTPGQTVTVTYAVAPPARPTGAADDTRKGNGRNNGNDHGDRKRDRDGGDN
jgi:eukaryotic-like serine/threonine-protein kinase